MKDLPEVSFFNTMTRSSEVLRPLSDKEVSLYCCGPTVYNYQHIGNLRTYIFEDLLVRTLRYAGYPVKHVMNITDVGHLVSDADQGEDKMLVAAKREGKSSMEIAEYYSKVFFEHCDWLNISPPTVICRATDHINEMIAMIQEIERGGYAYQSGGNVYFDVSKLGDYGKLAGLDLEGLKAGARIDVDKNKKSPLDFALWFTKSKFEKQELQWDSPWGRGYPGWHIECSAMSRRYLGDRFDIHCGGIDHIPVHHTNEIAQNQGACGENPAVIWMHGGFLVSDKEKMSKSKGEFLTLDLMKDKGYDPMAYRLFCLGAHYRRELTWSWEALDSAANKLSKLKNLVQDWGESLGESVEGERVADSPACKKYRRDFEVAMYDDLNAPRAIAVLYDMTSDTDVKIEERLSLLYSFDEILGLDARSWILREEETPSEIHELVERREQARRDKNWEEADRIREELKEKGYAIRDTKEGTKAKLL